MPAFPGTAARRAIVRPPSDSFAEAISSLGAGAGIDPERARAQHRDYVACLRGLGLEVLELDPDEEHPDACFTQDTAVVLGGRALACRMGAESRRGEELAVAERLAELGFPVQAMDGPATLDGGDVLIAEELVAVGRSRRSNAQGRAMLGGLARAADYAFAEVAMGESLHLLSDMAYLGAGRLLAAPGAAADHAFDGLELVETDPDEAVMANVLVRGASIVTGARGTRTANRLRERGFDVHELDLSEFAKADGGPTCLSLLA